MQKIIIINNNNKYKYKKLFLLCFIYNISYIIFYKINNTSYLFSYFEGIFISTFFKGKFDTVSKSIIYSSSDS